MENVTFSNLLTQRNKRALEQFAGKQKFLHNYERSAIDTNQRHLQSNFDLGNVLGDITDTATKLSQATAPYIGTQNPTAQTQYAPQTQSVSMLDSNLIWIVLAAVALIVVVIIFVK